jgi:YVTN family beta-propeller protein
MMTETKELTREKNNYKKRTYIYRFDKELMRTKIEFLFCIALLLFILLMTTFINVYAASETGAVSVISVGAVPEGIAYDSSKGEIFVANTNDNSVSVISDADNTVVATISVGRHPTGLAYDSGKGEVFVATSDGVSIISDESNTVVATVALANYPSTVLYDSGKGEIFVACSIPNNNGSVAIISDDTNAVIATVIVGHVPGNMAYDSAKGEVYVPNVADNTVSVISDSTNAVVATVNMVPNPQYYSSIARARAAAYDSSKGEIYVAIYWEGMVSTI